MESLRGVFGRARAAMKKYPGCREFAAAVTRMLNVDLRPFIAKWRRAYAEGRLQSRDEADGFRGELASVQGKLRQFAKRMHEMAYGEAADDEQAPSAVSPDELNACFDDLAFGICRGPHSTDAAVLDAINVSEKREIRRRREQYGIVSPEGQNAVGLSLSGGGVRSAAFCLGVTQVLAERDLFRDIDFLSTVSGGGYTGSFITSRLGEGAPHADIARPHGPDSAAIAYLRLHVKHLTAKDLWDRWSMVAATLAGLVLNWSVPLLVIVLAGIATRASTAIRPDTGGWNVLLVVASVIAGAALVLYCWLIGKNSDTAWLGGTLLGILAAVAMAIGLGWLLHTGYFVLPNWIRVHLLGVVSVGGLAVAGPAILRFMPVLRTPTIREIALKAMLFAAGLVAPIGAVAVYYACCHLGGLAQDAEAPFGSPLRYLSGMWILVCFAVALAPVALWLLNINLTSPHRLYRNRLARAFVQQDESDPCSVPLKNVNATRCAPYHLLNAAVNLPSSTNPALRDRKCDFFLFSKHWCGSAATGYFRTRAWRTNGLPLDLATAMAISGAAASSHMGLELVPSLTALLTLLNVRLGFWLARPDRTLFFRDPGFRCLVREMTGVAMSEKNVWLNLTDGGHIENLGAYELLRRRCKFIICVDAEADPEFTFGGLMTLVRHVQIDLGIRIDSKLNELRRDPQTHRSQSHGVLCRVHYPATDDQPAAVGLLLYLKLSVTGNEPELVKRYLITHPGFPHQNTLDQFFDQEQFEAYRQLGVHSAEGFFSATLMNSEGPPASVPEWFRRLAHNLLEPEGD